MERWSLLEVLERAGEQVNLFDIAKLFCDPGGDKSKEIKLREMVVERRIQVENHSMSIEHSIRGYFDPCFRYHECRELRASRNPDMDLGEIGSGGIVKACDDIGRKQRMECRFMLMQKNYAR